MNERNKAWCVVCGELTEVIVNIKMQARHVCDACCLAITQQTVATLTVKSLKNDLPDEE